MLALKAASAQEELADFVSQFYGDPYGFVRACFPWGEPGELSDQSGTDKWQEEFLKGLAEDVKRRKFNGVDPVEPIRRAVSSGHGTGKSTLVAWIVCWVMSTRPFCRGTITANTFTQLETKTWASVQRWAKLCLTADWFVIGSERFYHREYKESWFFAPQSCREENSEAFAGQHAANSSSVYIFDEDSAISEQIHTVAEGGLTDGEPMIFLFGNPTRNQGHFYDACFGGKRHRWNPLVLDSRECRFTNKAQIAEWIADYGEDSDFVRVRVRGLPPAASDAQFIDTNRIREAQKRDVAVLPDEPLVVGVDLAWGGNDGNSIWFRRGLDARTLKPIRIPGEFTRDPAVLTNRLADVLSRTWDGHSVAMMFIDSAGIAGPIAARLREMGFRNVQEVNFGADSPDMKFRYMRDYIWGQLKDWLLRGAIPNDPALESDLTGPGVRSDVRQRVWLESKQDMKKRGVDSPDDADALALTFAAPVGSARKVRSAGPIPREFAWS